MISYLQADFGKIHTGAKTSAIFVLIDINDDAGKLPKHVIIYLPKANFASVS
ncbi:hypothetical protein NIES4106_14390 [Fischerella sp. NIES-4106]|jgi:hypothetical protein|nr:hypothetical protein NIES4106_14390 [Fischerella sp. NIES-4106]